MQPLLPSLQTIVNGSKDFLLVTNEEFQIIGVSQEAREYLGITEVNEFSFETFYLEDLESFRNEVCKYLQGKKKELSIKIVDSYGIHHLFSVEILKFENVYLLYHFLVSSKDAMTAIHTSKKDKEVNYPLEMISLDNKVGDMYRKANKKLLQFEKLFSMMPVISAVIQYDGQIKLMNSAWEEILGFNGEESAQKPFYENIHPEDYEFTIDSLDSIKETGGTIHSLVNRFRCKNGKYKWLSWSMSIDKKHKLLYAAAFDVSEQKKSEEQLHKHQDLLNVTGLLATVGGWEYDIDSMNMTWTKEMFSMYGMKGKQPLALQEQVERFKKESARIFQEAIDRAFMKGEAWDLELQLDDDRERWVRTIGKVETKDGLTLKLFGAMQDITAYKNLEATLKKVIVEAHHANQAKTEFLANISHEIRTPITSILGYTDILQGVAGTEKERKHLKTIKTAGENLLHLMEDLIDMSVMEAGRLKIRYEMTDIHSVLADIQNILEHKAMEKGLQILITIDSNMPERLLIDEIRIKQVLLNLIENAIKFTETGTVKIQTKVHKKDDKKADIEFWVEDTGIGIPEDQYVKIFEPFCQMDGQNSRKYGGAGLGLSISRHLVELMNGVIRVESHVGIGTKFILVFKDIIYQNLSSNYQNIEFHKQIVFVNRPKILEEQREHTKDEVLDKDLQDALLRQFLPRYERLKTIFIIDQIKMFANDIKEFSKEYNIQNLILFGERLQEAACEYNIRETRSILDEFEEIATHIVKQHE